MLLEQVRKENGMIVTRFGSDHSFEDALYAIDNLMDLTGTETQIYELVIHEKSIKSNMTKQEQKLLREKLKRVYSKFQRGAIAFVSTQNYIFALCRQFEMLMENENIAIAVFRSETLAYQWIEEIQSLHKLSENPDSSGG